MLHPSEITEIARQTAIFLHELQQADDEKWISQNKAWKRHGGRAFVTKRKIIKENAVLNKKQLQNERDRIKAEHPANVKVYFDYEEI